MPSRIFACLLLLLASLPSLAAEPEQSAPEKSADPAPQSATAQETDRAVRSAIRQLDNDTFAERRAAAEFLRDAGAAAITPLADACRDGAGERVAQSIEILQSFAASEDREVSNTALTALQKIAAGENATAAKLAKSAVAATRAIPGRQPAMQLGQGNDQGRANPFMDPFGGRGRNISISTVRNNGQEKIKITDDDRRVEIDKDPNGPIRIEWQDGDEAAQVAKADDLDALRNAHPKAAAVYDDYQQMIAAGPGLDGPGPDFLLPMRFDGPDIPQPMRQMEAHFDRMRADHQRMINEMRTQHEMRVQNMRQFPPPRPVQPPAQLRQLQDDAQRLQERVQNGEVDEATRKELARLQKMLNELQQQIKP